MKRVLTFLHTYRLLAASICMLLLSLMLNACARLVPGFANAYSRHVYAFLTRTQGSFSGLFPISLFELCTVFLLCFLIFDLVRTLYHAFSSHKASQLLSFPLHCIYLAAALLLIYQTNCGINYHRTPFSVEAGIRYSSEEESADDLRSLCRWLVSKIRETEKLAEVDDIRILGETQETKSAGALELFRAGRNGQAAMQKLGILYPELAGDYPYPKPLINSRVLSIQQLTGMYAPFTIEANYNREIPYYNIPFTICHELSHLRGYMQEEEANFIAFLACVNANDAYFNYSGYLSAWVYAGNALYERDYTTFAALYGQLPDKAKQDLSYNNMFWDQYETPVSQTSERINDAYLKSNGQTQGVKSYDHVTELLLAYYCKQIRG